MYRAENVPVAICTISTLTVTTNPTSPTLAATTAARTASAVLAEYCQRVLRLTTAPDSVDAKPSNHPSAPPMKGTIHRLSRTYRRSRNATLQVMRGRSAASSCGLEPFRVRLVIEREQSLLLVVLR